MHLPGVPIVTQQPFLHIQLTHVRYDAFVLTLFVKRFNQQTKHADHQLQAAKLQIHGQVSQVATLLSSILSSKSRLLLLLANRLVYCTA